MRHMKTNSHMFRFQSMLYDCESQKICFGKFIYTCGFHFMLHWVHVLRLQPQVAKHHSRPLHLSINIIFIFCKLASKKLFFFHIIKRIVDILDYISFTEITAGQISVHGKLTSKQNFVFQTFKFMPKLRRKSFPVRSSHL